MTKMKERVSSTVFSLNGMSITIGALGFLSGVVQLFIDTSSQLSVKWLLLVVWLASSLLLILLKVIYDLSNERHTPSPFEVPIKFIEDSQIFVIRRNDNFLNNVVVGCYVQHEGVDTLACLGVVHIVQEKVIQIRVVGAADGIKPAPVAADAHARIVIRPVVPFDALNQLTSGAVTDE